MGHDLVGEEAQGRLGRPVEAEEHERGDAELDALSDAIDDRRRRVDVPTFVETETRSAGPPAGTA